MVMCKAGEVAKIVINKCLDRGIRIGTLKLEKLLVLMQVECIKRSKKPLFTEEIVVWHCGVAIKEVDEGFLKYACGFNEKQTEYIALLDKEVESVEYVLKSFGHMDAYDLNKLPTIKRLVEMAVVNSDKTYIPLIAIQGMYQFD